MKGSLKRFSIKRNGEAIMSTINLKTFKTWMTTCSFHKDDLITYLVNKTELTKSQVASLSNKELLNIK